MADKIMHHVVIGSDTYEIVDEQGRATAATNTQDISSLKEDSVDLKSAIGKYEDNVVLFRNLITTVESGKATTGNSAGQNIAYADNTGYGCAIVPVKPNGTYTINSTNYNNNFSCVVNPSGVVTGKLRGYQDAQIATVYVMPDTASYIVLCSNQLSESNDKNVVVLEADYAITDLTEYNITNYPYDTVKKVVIKELYDGEHAIPVNEMLGTIPTAPFINSYYYQYIDKSKWQNGVVWMNESPNVTAHANSGYNAYPPFELPAGSYRILNCSGNFSFVKYTDGTIVTFASIRTSLPTEIGDRITLTKDGTVYISNGDITYTMLSNGEFENDGTNPIFIYGMYRKSTKNIYYCGHTRPLNTLRKAVEAATQYMDSTIYIDAETFDLVDEFADVLPSITGSSQKEGLLLKNRVTLVFASGAKVIFNYTGSNTHVQECFSPFNAGEYGFTLENAWVESTNCRYSVHDEMNSSDIPYVNKYKNCTFIHDSHATAWGAHQAIGGGLGRYGAITIKDCYASSVGAYDTSQPVISYHNAGTDREAKSIITITGCYIADGSIRVTNNGANTVKSRAIVSGCNVYGREPYYEKTISSGRADNMEIIQWNNIVRTT